METWDDIEKPSITISIEFEVWGEIQAVYFRKYFEEECTKLGLTGWVKNTRRGSIIGKIEGPKPRVQEMTFWLKRIGPPGSRIDRCDLYNYQYMARPQFRRFRIRAPNIMVAFATINIERDVINDSEDFLQNFTQN